MSRLGLTLAVVAAIALITIQMLLPQPRYHERPRAMDPVTFIFPNIHHHYAWDVADGGSLWSIFILNNIVESPIRYDNQTNLQPGLVDSWSYSDNRKTLTLRISDRYTFHDGQNITANDVARSLLRAVSSHKSVHSDIYDILCGNDDCSRVSTDGNMISIRLDKQVNGLLTNLATPEFGVVPPMYKVSADKRHLANLSGPYKVTSFDAKQIALRAYEKHPLIDERSPRKAYIREIRQTDQALDYYRSNPNTVLIASDYSSASKLTNIQGSHYISSRALTEFIVPNLNSPYLDSIQKRKRIFAKLQRAKQQLHIDETLAERTNQVFTQSSAARFDEDLLAGVYPSEIEDEVPSISLRLLIFDWMKESPIPFQLKEILETMGINLEITVASSLERRGFFRAEEFDFLYIYSGVSAPEPIIELIYLFKHPTFLLSHKNRRGSELIGKAKHASSERESIEIIRKIHHDLISEYRILPVMHTSMMYISNGDVRLESSNVFDGSFNIWDWRVRNTD